MKALKSKLAAIKNRPALVALIFSLFLTIAEAFLFDLDYLAFARSALSQPAAHLLDAAAAVFAFAVLFFFVRSLLVSRYGWQCAYFGVFALALALEYGFQGALARFTLPSDLENTFYASDASDKLGAVTLFFNWLVLVPLLFFRLLFYLAPDDARQGARLFFVNLLVLCGGFLLFADFQRPALPANAFAAHFNNLTSSALYFGERKWTPNARVPVAPVAESAARVNNIVLIVDESVRADHLSLNGYGRKTTPTLERMAARGVLFNWRAGVSGATESVGSNRLLLTGLRDLPDRDERLETLPTIFQYARAAGYRTFYFDGQDYAHWIGSAADRADFGRIFTAADFPGVAPYDLDRAFAGKIRELTDRSTGNFIWVNKRGAHFRYEKNYPPAGKVWMPTDAEAERAEKATGRPLVNNYDNALLYNSETFFGELSAGDFPGRTIYVYTSDHGQTLRPDRASHAGDTKAEALVPIVLIGVDEHLRKSDINYPAAHRNLFATLLDLMNYPRERRVYDYAPSLFEARSADAAPRAFFVGNLTGAFGGKSVLFDDVP